MKRILTYKIFESKGELTENQIKWLDSCTDGKWNLNPGTGLVDVKGDFNCSNQSLDDFKGIKFGKVSGSFLCHNNRLTSLGGAPKRIGQDFFCTENQLTSLEGAPEKVGGSFTCGKNQLTSLEGAPDSVGRSFHCSYNQLTSLEGAPKSVGRIFKCDNNQLTSLRGVPKRVGGGFECSDNPVSERVLEDLYRIMQDGKSYPQALSQYWDKMPEDDRILMYKDNPDLDADEKRGYELRARAGKRIY